MSQCKVAGSAIAASCSSSNINSNAGSFTAGSSQSGQQINSQQQAQVSDMCRQAGQNAQDANGTINTVMQQCQSAMSSCSSACSSVSEAQLTAAQRTELATARSQCSSGSAAMQNLQNQQNQVQANQQRAQQCLNDAGMGGTMNQPNSNTTNCLQTPNAPGCIQAKQDCSNPEFAASNEVCKCMSGNCDQGQTRAASQPDEGYDQSAGSFDASPSPESAGLDGSASPHQSSRMDPSFAGGGGGGGAGVGGGSGGANKPGLKSTRQASTINADTLAGNVGGKGAGRFGTGPSSEDKGTYSNSGSWIPPKLSDEKVDLDKFRPKLERDALRVPASMNVHNEVYASHVNMWRQVNLRYINLMGTLSP